VTPTVALTIAGSDSGGGAGLQADLRTFAALGVFGTTAVTAVTAQNTQGVQGVVVMDPDFVLAQIQAVTQDMVVAATKTGMLATPDTIAAVARFATPGALPNLVVDPVLVSSTGHPLMAEGGVRAYRELLFPLAAVVTPNLREAALLTGRRLRDLADVDSMIGAAHELRGLGPQTVVVKGGHLATARSEASRSADEADAPDVVATVEDVVVLPAPRVSTRNDHGTGCSLAAAIAAQLACGASHLDAVTRAKAFVRRALDGSASWQLGSGHGPIDHFGWSAQAADDPPTAAAETPLG
jgi:hydroxymethylpyrimidine/phosphomethylpyrimidine kinase